MAIDCREESALESENTAAHQCDERSLTNTLEILYALKKKCWTTLDHCEELLQTIDKGSEAKLASFADVAR